MSKRQNTSSIDNRAKRQHIDDFRSDTEFVSSIETTNHALASLAEQADELVDCLQSLKRQFLQNKKPADFQFENIKSNLSRLTKQLLPSFQIIGSIDEPITDTKTSTVWTVLSKQRFARLTIGMKGYPIKNYPRLTKHTGAVSY